jgi:hypothetical protein
VDLEMFEQVVKDNGKEEGVCARFYDKAVKTGRVDKAGFPVFEMKTYVEIRLKDNTTEIFDQPALADKIKRFPREYALYKLQRKQIEKGTPLDQFAFLTAAELASLKARGIFTVEALSELSSEKAELLDISSAREKARRFRRFNAQNEEKSSFEQREKDLLAQVESLQKQVAVLKQKETHKKQTKTKNKKEA